MSESNLISALLDGKQLRVRYKSKNEDYCDPPGWWIEELWKYNRKTKMIECYYPVSSYDSGFYTAYNLESAKYQMNDVWCDYKEGGLTLKFENNNTSEDEKKSIKEIAIEKIMEMDDDEIISRLLL